MPFFLSDYPIAPFFEVEPRILGGEFWQERKFPELDNGGWLLDFG